MVKKHFKAVDEFDKRQSDQAAKNGERFNELNGIIKDHWMRSLGRICRTETVLYAVI